MGQGRNQLEQYKRYLQTKAAALTDHSAQAKRAYEEAFATIAGNHKPVSFGSATSVLKEMENGFEKLLVVLSECGCPAPDELTTFRFYHWLDYLDEKFEAQRGPAQKPKQTPPKHDSKR